MKKIFNICIAATVAALAVVSCQKKAEPYQPGTPDEPGCYGVYFPTQEASGAHTYDPDMATEVVFKVARTNTSGAITVPYSTSFSDENIFNVGQIQFADGQSETELKVTFPNVNQGQTYKLSVTLSGNEYVSKYSKNAISIDFSVLQVKWEDFLNPVTEEPAVITLYEGWWAEVHQAKLRYYEVNDVRTCVLTSIEEGNGIWGDTYGATLQFTWYLKENNEAGKNFLEVPKQYFGFDYDDWTSKDPGSATSPIYVYDYYHYWIERGYSPEELDGGWLGFAKKEGQSDGSGGYPVGYYDGNGGFIFNLRYYIPGLGGFSPDPYEFQAIADGFTRVDYSLEMESDFTQDGITPIAVEAGADIAYLNFAIYEGELNSAQLAAKYAAIKAGTEEVETFDELEFDEDEGKAYGIIGIAPDKTGFYTVVAVGYSEDDEPQAEAAVVCKHIAAEDTEKFAVDIDVFTEPVHPRFGDQFNEYNSFAFGIVGNDIKEAHLYIAPSSKVTATTLELVKATASLSVDDEILAAINGLGGYYDVVSGLDPGTAYSVVVWATNGEEDTIVIDTWETTPSPEVWAPVGTATWTDLFFGPWFGADPISYDVMLEESQDVAGRYRLLNVYGEPFPYNDPGDWDDSKDYYCVINADDPDKVWMETFDSGCNWGYGDFILTSDAGYYVTTYGVSIDELKEDEDVIFGTLKDNVITFPVDCILKAMASYNNGSWYFGNHASEFVITLNFKANAAGLASVKDPVAKTSVNRNAEKANLRPVEKQVFERDPQPVKVSVVKMDNVRREKAPKGKNQTISAATQNVR